MFLGGIKATLAFVKTHLPDKAPGGWKIPPNSLYSPIRDKVEGFLNFLSPTFPADVFAKRFVPHVLKKNPRTIVMDGEGLFMTRILAYLATWFGVRTFDWAWGFVDGLPELTKILRAEEKDKGV